MYAILEREYTELCGCQLKPGPVRLMTLDLVEETWARSTQGSLKIVPCREGWNLESSLLP